ncbi:protein nervous wreck isoform X2 [Atheta coriaria]
MWNVWRTVLEENEKLARARLAAVEVFQQQIAEEAKVLRSHKVAASKKCVDQLALVQKELQTCVQDVDKTKKLYFDEEHCAHDVRDKARDIEEKLKKKKGSFFQSITSLQKNSAKFSSKREQLEEKSAGARNDYLLCLAAANAHQNRYFLVDLQLCMSTMESNVFDKVAEFLMLMGRTELLTCSAMQNSFSTIRDQAKQLTREYNLQCVYLYYPVLKQHIQYEYEPCDNDPIEVISADHENAAATLSKEARRWATKIARENANIRDGVRKLQIYHALRESGQRVDPNDQNGPDLDTKMEDLKQSIRRSETSKMKAEARLEYLRAGGVNVDEWLQEAETLNVQDIQRSASSLSDHPSSDSYYDSDFADGEPSATPQPPVDVKIETDYDERPVVDSDEEDSQQEVDGEWAMLEQERQRIEQMTAGWDDPTQVDWGAVAGEETEAVADAAPAEEPAPPTAVLKCTAIYSYTAQNPDELTIVENEQLEVVGEGDGDGWLRARNYRGEEGYVPHNYLDVEREQSATTPGLQNQISFSSVDYTIDQEDDVTANTDTANQSPDQVSVIAAPTAAIQPDAFEPKTEYCVALYDYDGDPPEELTFDEGNVIRLISRCAHSIDDGWWKGELEGRIGNFPSLVVELCDEYGEPLSNPEDQSPPPSAPPVFTPPDVPEDFINDMDITPTEDDMPLPGFEPPSIAPPPAPPGAEAESDPEPPTPPANSARFKMEMTRGQKEQYGTQFEGSDIPTIDITTVATVDSDGNEKEDEEDDDGLGVVQIEITAATPMMEEPEQPFPPPEESSNHEQDDHEPEELPPVPEEEEEETPRMCRKPPQAPVASDDGDLPHVADTPPCPISSSSEGDTTGPSTAENSVSHAPPQQGSEDAPKQVVGGRASIPDELEPHQLARLQELKESNA